MFYPVVFERGEWLIGHNRPDRLSMTFFELMTLRQGQLSCEGLFYYPPRKLLGLSIRTEKRRPDFAPEGRLFFAPNGAADSSPAREGWVLWPPHLQSPNGATLARPTPCRNPS